LRRLHLSIFICISSKNAINQINEAARTCYRSEEKAGAENGEKLVKKLKDLGQHAMLEFADITVKITTDRAVSHELVGHRVASFAQESQRYVNYGGGSIKFIKPSWAGKHEDAYEIWKRAVNQAAETYAEMIGFCGIPAQSARTVLPNSTATVIIIKANIREWLHIFSLRGSAAAHPQMRSLMLPMMADFHARLPLIFDAPEGTWEAMDVSYKEGPHD